MRKIIAMLLVLFILLLSGCGTTEDVTELTEAEKFDYQGYDWENLLLSDAFDTSDGQGNYFADAVTVSVDNITETHIMVRVKAPDAYTEVKEWFDAISEEEYSDEKLGEKIREALDSEKKENVFELSYQLLNNRPYINYSDEYINAVGCGMITFYNELNESFMDEMRAEING